MGAKERSGEEPSTQSPRGEGSLWEAVVCLPPDLVYLLDYSTLGFEFSAENHWRALLGEWPFYLFFVLKRSPWLLATRGL